MTELNNVSMQKILYRETLGIMIFLQITIQIRHWFWLAI